MWVANSGRNRLSDGSPRWTTDTAGLRTPNQSPFKGPAGLRGGVRDWASPRTHVTRLATFGRRRYIGLIAPRSSSPIHRQKNFEYCKKNVGGQSWPQPTFKRLADRFLRSFPRRLLSENLEGTRREDPFRAQE